MSEHDCIATLIERARALGAGEIRQVFYRSDDEPLGAVIVLDDEPEVVRAKLAALDAVEEARDE